LTYLGKKIRRNLSFLIYFRRKNDFAISAITQYEIGIGNKSSSSEFWNDLYGKLVVLPFDQNCSDVAIDVYASLKKKNQLIDLADIFIGATAKSHRIPIATLNKKHFQRIEGLIMI
jgi:tRNA(fMet)-specific endonuclease VapC